MYICILLRRKKFVQSRILVKERHSTTPGAVRDKCYTDLCCLSENLTSDENLATVDTDLINLADPPPFNIQEWISTGKQYSQDPKDARKSGWGFRKSTVLG